MCPGSIGHITSAAAVAASSFEMKATSPKEYLKNIDIQRLRQLLAKSDGAAGKEEPSLKYVEPTESQTVAAEVPKAVNDDGKAALSPQATLEEDINGKIQRLGDFVDTDAVSHLIRPV